VMADDVEVIDDSFSWFVRINGQEESQTSASAAVSLERGFQDGEKTVGFLHKDVPMVADFSNFNVYPEGSNAKSTQAVGQLRREPEEQWSMAEEKKVFDDGKWHILTIIVDGNVIAAVCDGEKLRVQYEGSLVTKVQDVMAAAQQPKLPGSAPGKTIASHVPFITTAPITLFASPISGDDFRKQTNMLCGSTFPRRLLGHFEVSWRKPDFNAVIAQHVIMDSVRNWRCRLCKCPNTRQVDTCTSCGESRAEKKGARETTQGKVKAVFLRSREAQAVRRKVQNKLRSQYQRLLDSYDNQSNGRRRAAVMEELL